ncbi:energy transducer TonB [Psychrobacter vallis]|uniref:energy transducer TonB n=1 Tax=Psychrobacter vallis TaxID=248451 RepID=UPI00191B0B9A|nr:energy transducer TonB [Psychrobacter vallis]
MRILIAIMIPNLFTRPVTAWITVLVILLHGVTVWAMMSIDSPKPLETKNKPKVIQLELITLAAQPEKNPSSTTALTPEPQSKPVPLESSLPKKPPAESTEKAKSVKPLPVMEAVEPLTTKTEKKYIAPVKSTELPTEKSDTEMEPTNFSSVQNLTIVESKKIASISNKTDNTKDEAEDDLSDMIRSVTEQFNRDQAAQKRSAAKQANQKRAEQEKWQAEYEAFSHMLALAADQAKQQADDNGNLNDTTDKESPVMAESGSWIDGEAPNTSISSVIWRSVDRRLGDVFIVMLELHIDTEGYITEVQLLESSGSPIVDAVATTQVRAGQLNPIIKDDKAVDAIVPMSLVYERP